jgi:hypothetical protein
MYTLGKLFAFLQLAGGKGGGRAAAGRPHCMDPLMCAQCMDHLMHMCISAWVKFLRSCDLAGGKGGGKTAVGRPQCVDPFIIYLG